MTRKGLGLIISGAEMRSRCLAGKKKKKKNWKRNRTKRKFNGILKKNNKFCRHLPVFLGFYREQLQESRWRIFLEQITWLCNDLDCGKLQNSRSVDIHWSVLRGRYFLKNKWNQPRFDCSVYFQSSSRLSDGTWWHLADGLSHPVPGVGEIYEPISTWTIFPVKNLVGVDTCRGNLNELFHFF